MKDFLIIIPAFNEEKNISKVLESLVDLKQFADIIIINDGSSDATEALVKGEHLFLINHPCNLGYGAALQTGFKFAKMKNYRFILQFDADGQHNPEDLKLIMTEMVKEEVDIVIGSRFLGNPDFHPGMLKQMAIFSFRWLIKQLAGAKVTDPTSGLRGLSYRVFSYYSVRDRFPEDFPDADMVIEMILQGYRVKEVPITSTKRTEGVSMHSGWKPIVYFMKILLSILTILLRNQMMRWNKNHG